MAVREWRLLETVPYMKTERESSRLRWLKFEEAERLLTACRTNADAILERRAADEGLVFGAPSFDSFRTAWETAVRKAKLTDFRFHDLRHTCASWMVQRGANLQEVKDVLGHSSLAMTLRYAHLSPEHLRKAVSALDGLLHSTTAAHEPIESATAVEEWTRSA